ncbi:MAG: universal stress protein UspA [Pirellulaceae bacterium]|nr:MAG: universal stress protein UspA [Pirellulaceae bacterium]
MVQRATLNTLLVPVDFSDASDKAFHWAMNSVDGEEPLIVILHVIDAKVLDAIETHELASREQAAKVMRAAAEHHMDTYRQPAREDVQVDCIVTEGLPFLEIIRKAKDFDVDAIVMGRAGVRQHMEKLFIGSTAEVVLRGAHCPVIVLPEEALDE